MSRETDLCSDYSSFPSFGKLRQVSRCENINTTLELQELIQVSLTKYIIILNQYLIGFIITY